MEVMVFYYIFKEKIITKGEIKIELSNGTMLAVLQKLEDLLQIELINTDLVCLHNGKRVDDSDLNSHKLRESDKVSVISPVGGG